MKKALAGLVLSIISVGTALADTAPGWKGEAELGLVLTSGNTEAQTLNGKLGVSGHYTSFRHTGKAEALQVSDADVVTAQRYLLSWKTDYTFSARNYTFGIISHEDDKFSGYDYRTTGALGYGHRFIDRDNLTLDLEAGPGMRHSVLDDGSSENQGLLRLAGNLLWKISTTSTLTEDLTSESGEDTTISKSVTGLKTQINGDLAMKVTLTLKHVSEVPVGVENTDTETAVTLVYSF